MQWDIRREGTVNFVSHLYLLLMILYVDGESGGRPAGLPGSGCGGR